MDEPVERRQQRRAPLEVLAERGGVDAPLALRALDHGRLAGLADVDRLDGTAVLFCRAMPSEASRRSFLTRSASSTDGTTTSAGYTRSGRSHSRSRPMRPAIATSPRIIRNSSICVTLRLFVHPVEAHGTTHVSGMSREVSGPELPSRSRMSRRNESLSRSQARVRS